MLFTRALRSFEVFLIWKRQNSRIKDN